MKRRKYFAVAAAVLAVLVLVACRLMDRGSSGAYDEELLVNGDLSELAENGLPAGWYTDAYVRTNDFSRFEVLPGAGPDGVAALHIVNYELNDARFAQYAAVEPESLYCLSGWIKAQTAGGWGANLSVADIYTSSENIYDSEGEWQRIALYGRTGKGQNSLTVFARLGGYSGESQGEAWFSGLSLQKVERAPEDAFVHDLSPIGYRNNTAQKKAFDLRHALLILFAVLYVMVACRCFRAGSLLGMLTLSLATAALSAFFVMADRARNVEIAYALAQPVAAVRYVVYALHLLTVLASLFLAYRMAQKKKVIPGLAAYAPRVITEKTGCGACRMDRKDWTIMAVVTVLYAALAYTHLGSMTSPQTAFVFTERGEQVVFDLGEHKTEFQLLYMGGIHEVQSDFTVEFSEDGVSWRHAAACEMDIGSLYQWKYVHDYYAADTRALSARYVRLTAECRGLTLLETLFRDFQGNPLPVTAVDSLGRDASALIDEPHALKGEPSWFNSMYFDEIYHARTGYEHLHGLLPYEISHPPLGKVFMSWCIALLGMTPFGWRFAGATCGVLMLPGMYLLGRLLFSRRRYAVLSCLLLAFDTLHFTQTRIATIDSFVVLFIIWSVYFMLRWFYADIFGQRLWRSLRWLALSGMFMGLAVASKWTGCFAGVGLAAIFFYGIWRKAHGASGGGRKRLFITVASCLIFFVAVPAVIYWCAYIPYFAPSGGVSVGRIADAASYMLGYHSEPGVGMNHPYYSPWYQWPLSQKPMYYAADDYTPSGYVYAIWAMGNYAVWWVGFAALLLTVYAWAMHQLLPSLCGGYRQRISPLAPEGERDERPALLLICFAAQFLPWVLVPRGTYIYHYFPSVPFIILCISYVLECLNAWCVSRHEKAERWFAVGVGIYLLIVCGMFVAFFPVASGALVRHEWIDAINWFHNLAY